LLLPLLLSGVNKNPKSYEIELSQKPVVEGEKKEKMGITHAL
jgi:hypothetical protein